MRKVNCALAALIVALAAAIVFMLVAAPASAKKPVKAAAATATVTATYQEGTVSLAGCGFDPVTPIMVTWTHPSGSFTGWIGMWNDDLHGHGCMDSNYVLATDPGLWTATIYQFGVEVATAQVTVPSG